jgi:hypothetical protein
MSFCIALRVLAAHSKYQARRLSSSLYVGGYDLDPGISLDLSYSLYGHSLLAALFPMSHIQPLHAALRPAYIEPYSLGFHNQRISSRIGLQHFTGIE